MQKEPEFWKNRGWLSAALLPLSWLYRGITRIRQTCCCGFKGAIPVICIGNVTAGGAGKTQVALAIGQMLIDKGYPIAFVSRGYGGTLAGPVQVETTRHNASQVGDEPLLLSTLAPVFVSKDRGKAIILAQKNGAQVIIMDDGFQNPSVQKDFSLLVIDGHHGMGNGRVMPAGPLRETLASALQRCQAVVMVGGDAHRLASVISVPILRAKIEATYNNEKRKSFVAFAGIARPEKFFNTLEEYGYHAVETVSYPDHYTYKDTDLQELFAKALHHGAALITTEKDAVRLPKETRPSIVTLPVALRFEDKAAVERMLELALSNV